MNDPCTVWMALSDREAVGELLNGDEQTFLARHADRCPVCARERAVWQELGAIVEQPAPASVARLHAATPVQTGVQAEVGTGVPTQRERALPWRGMLASAAAVLVLVVGGDMAWRSAPSSPAPAASASTPTPPSAPGSATAGASVALGNTGQVEVDGRLAAGGEPIREGSTVYARRGTGCLTVEPGVRACLAEGSLLRVTELGLTQRRLSLQAGRVAAELDPQPAGTSFGVTTRDGAAIAIGTAFSVEVPVGRGTSVTRVMHGTVLVRSVTGREHRVTAHRMAEMDGEPRALLAADEQRELALVEAIPRVSSKTPEPVRDSTVVTTSTASNDRARAQEPRASPPPPAVSTNARAHGAARLLLTAREARARGDTGASTIAYRALFARHDQSPEAHAARVPYGEILLTDGAYRAALAAFERYLARGGPLAEEASFGRIRALRALGVAADERAALASFLDAYPHSPLCTSLRVRAEALGAL